MKFAKARTKLMSLRKYRAMKSGGLELPDDDLEQVQRCQELSVTQVNSAHEITNADINHP